VGHADRSRLDHALRLDAQSRGVRFPLAQRRGDSNTNANCDRDGHGNADSYRNRYSYLDTYAYCYSYTCSKDHADSKASPNAKAASITRTSESAVYDRRRRDSCRNEASP
jgi:hypothetical protein